MELWDAYYADGRRANQTLVRGEPIPRDYRHLVSEILVRHKDGDYLLMQRDFSKPAYGGYYEATAGGSALRGEDSRECAIRELYEETGIRAETLWVVGRAVTHDTIYVSYLCFTDCDKASVTLQAGETVAYKWVNREEFIAFLHSDSVIGTQKARYAEFFRRMHFIE